MRGIQILVTAIFPDGKGMRGRSSDKDNHKQGMQLKQRTHNFEQKVKHDLQMALKDKNISREIISQMDDIVIKRKLLGRRPEAKDVVKLNIKAMGV